MRKVRNTIRRLFIYNNPNITLFCNNCLAGCILHDLGMKFNSPTINLYIPFPDYIDFLENLKYYLSIPMMDITMNSKYPIGWLANPSGGGIKIHFLHYETFAEANESWIRRSKRISWENNYFILVERDGCTYEDLLRFDKLPFKHKVALVHKQYKGLQSQFVIKGFENDKQVGNVMDYKGLFGKRIYDQFCWIKFFNNK